MVTINPMLTATLGCVLLEQPSKLPFKTTRCCFATLGVLVCCAVVACIRRMFQNNNSVIVAAPTGAAAHNVGGQTIHREFKIDMRKKQSGLSTSSKEALMNKLETMNAVFLDERSMISQNVLGKSEENVRITAHGGGHENEDWGGIPVVVLFGDDYQLIPPCEVGAIDSFFQTGNNSTLKNGAFQFINLGQNTSELNIIVRQNKDQEEFRDLLANTRIGKPSDTNVKTLVSLHLNSNEFSVDDIKAIEKKLCMHLPTKK
jgi:hypothetical protein